MILQVDDKNRVRTLTLNRPDVLNAFNEALYEATAEALRMAADDPDIAVVLLTGAGRAFSAGNDLREMQARITDPEMANQGSHFTTMIDVLTRFPNDLANWVQVVGLSPAWVLLAVIALYVVLGTFLGMPLFTMLPVVAKRVFGLGAQGLSLFQADYGVGSVIGAVFVASATHR